MHALSNNTCIFSTFNYHFTHSARDAAGTAFRRRIAGGGTVTRRHTVSNVGRVALGFHECPDFSNEIIL